MSILWKVAELNADEVAWDLKRPCNDCPFRRDAPDHQGVCASIVGYVDTIDAGNFAHTCHKTDNRAHCDGPRNHAGPVQHCAGALHFLIRSGDDLQRTLLTAAQRGKLDLKAVIRRARRDRTVFGSVLELVEYYAAMAQRLLNVERTDPVVCCVFDDEWGNPPEKLPLSQALASGATILECKKCGKPAIHYDNHWPYHTEANFCAEHSSEGIGLAARELADLERLVAK